jgi:hypothetical protein
MDILTAIQILFALVTFIGVVTLAAQMKHDAAERVKSRTTEADEAKAVETRLTVSLEQVRLGGLAQLDAILDRIDSAAAIASQRSNDEVTGILTRFNRIDQQLAGIGGVNEDLRDLLSVAKGTVTDLRAVAARHEGAGNAFTTAVATLGRQVDHLQAFLSEVEAARIATQAHLATLQGAAAATQRAATVATSSAATQAISAEQARLHAVQGAEDAGKIEAAAAKLAEASGRLLGLEQGLVEAIQQAKSSASFAFADWLHDSTKDAVAYVEQMAGNAQKRGVKWDSQTKRDAAIQYVQKAAQAATITLQAEHLEAIRHGIEAAVHHAEA